MRGFSISMMVSVVSVLASFAHADTTAAAAAPTPQMTASGQAQVGTGVDATVTVLNEQALFDKIRSQGVPEHGLKKIFEYLHQTGHSFPVDYYNCPDNKPENAVKPCLESHRVSASKSIILQPKDYAVVVDFTKPSTEKRFFLINLKTGKVTSYLSAHGRGSGAGTMAYKFGNQPDSEMSSLGMYVTGETYVGEHGVTLRMYGLEKSNDNAYSRDIVLHGAYYADASFFQHIDYSTMKPYTRLGLSWGCPAVSGDAAKVIIPLLQGGALMYLDQPEVADEALSGRDVETSLGLMLSIHPYPLKKPVVAPVPLPRPAFLRVEQPQVSASGSAGEGTQADGTAVLSK